ncbi:nitrate/nitrite response regulator protein NarP [Cronobacter dublinensis subsp. dublinensis]|uniref:nitrate/nitrite response regulator protein NarP n=1 Tax=Cronobacter dublinensis TaxID=413497 RepID=UPI000D002FEE|nr:nitrate/nitrite response regulator protein NarP [Cronobacter dublinensis]EGT5660548.1 nitrate/nitrite response regulator protein NarP [Cronobacter dublinensis subsp. dublinensis]EGT5667910.1 nitrate/nitrite response regulator protein NarP [Cronobacter dublinensis subsp. dublinensis]EGT5672884.1 nitrate/nitrite response regulator protein NarP [Cronobacter dublinensis subsp. dublinensis]EGT5677615.1 nitrate/nitrite response regulator protein NarP [Cronobacter dublinensis subsp. dublinensis]EG
MSQSDPWHVVIVDDHPLMRRGIRQLLETDAQFNVVGEASGGAEAIALANQLTPDIILLDLNMRGLSGLDTLTLLRRDGVSARIIVLTVSDARSDVYAVMDAGADGYLLKDSEPEMLLAAIRDGAAGDGVFSAQVETYLRQRLPGEKPHSPFALLTERELDVLQEVARGLSNKQIASTLHISEETVKVHIRNLLRKLNVRSRVAATVLFFESRGA